MSRNPTFALILCLGLPPVVRAAEFAGDIFLIGQSVASNGAAGLMPTQPFSPSQHLTFPSEQPDEPIHALEINALPLFGSVARAYNAAATVSLDSQSQISAYYSIIRDDDIQLRPLLRGTREERMNDPSLRPTNCRDCGTFLTNMVTSAGLNFARSYSMRLPRSQISHRPIPLELNIGGTAKYFIEELWSGDYTAQNLNLDAGIGLTFFWDYHPITRLSTRNIKIIASGFELLPTAQIEEFGGSQVKEAIDSRWHYTFVWEEEISRWESRFTLSSQQRSEGGKWPGLGAEWNFKNMLFARTGFRSGFFSAGASLSYRMVSVHYAFIHHELATTLYQVSMQVRWP